MPALDSLVHRLRPAAGSPAGALVLFHGRGADEHDLFPLLDVLDPERRLVGACPGGPLHLPPGGRHWYVVPRVGFPDPDTFRASFAALDGWLQAFEDHTGVPPERTVLGGFSQGAVMAWSLGLGPGRPRPAGLVAMSGFIPTVPGFVVAQERAAGLPVAIAHGSGDPVIGIDFGRHARDWAQAAGAEVTYRESAMGHTIDPRVLGELTGWVRERLPDGP